MMTDSEINEAIAEVCGWTRNGSALGRWLSPDKSREQFWVPSYCYDLNAMHEVEMKYPWDDKTSRLDYVCVLEKVVSVKYGATLFATARQRAEAFLRTIGKWKEVNA